MPSARIRSIEFATSPEQAKPVGGNVDLQVELEDGSFSSFIAATPEQPDAWMKSGGADFSFGTPVLFLARLERETVGEAVEAMAGDMGGYWLRYYNSLGDLSEVGRTLRLAEGRKNKKGKKPR